VARDYCTEIHVALRSIDVVHLCLMV
jgi:hypothetical protein